MKHTFRKLRTALLGAGAAAVATAALAMPAVAADANLVNPDAEGSITLTKRGTASESNEQQDGKPIAGGITDPLEGATFELYKVDTPEFDLATNAGWQALQAFIDGVGPHPSKTVLDAAATLNIIGSAQTTPADGTINWTDLELGLYYVIETGTPAGYKPSAPFFVTIPMTDPDSRDAWMYDVHVYPKNLKDETVKIPQDTDTPKAGDELVWKLTTVVPGSDENNVKVLRITDQLDPNLDYTKGDTTVTVDGVVLTEGDEYTESWDDASRLLTITFTTEGINKLNEEELWGKTITVDIKTTVTANFNGDVENEATVITNRPGTDNEVEVTTPKTESKYGKAIIKKYAMENGAEKMLPGAEFQLYYSHTKTPDLSVKNNANTGIAPVIGKTCTTDTDGTCTINGLRYSDFAEGVQLQDTDGRYNWYWLVETKAPEGYELLAEPTGSFVITDATQPGGAEWKVENVKRGGGIELPFTGGAGTIVFLICGVALLGGTALLVANRARKTESK